MFTLTSFEEPDVGDVKHTYSNIDRTNLTYLSYHRQKHIVFGEIKQISGEIRNTSKCIQDNWLLADIYSDFPNELYAVYEFEKYIDVPISIKSVTKLDAGQKIERSRQIINSQELTNQQITSEGFRYLNNFSNNYDYNYGVMLDALNFGYDTSHKILIESELEKNITYSKTYTYSLEEIITESEIWENLNSFPEYYQVNYRQKFKMYFVNVYQYLYEIIAKSQFGCTTYEYKRSGLIGSHTYFTLVPVDPPYYHVSRYYDDDLGIRKPLNLNHENIVYI